MKILTAIIKTILTLIILAVLFVIAMFFLTVFMPDNMVQAISIFKNIFSIS
jgi:hypothetical protein